MNHASNAEFDIRENGPRGRMPPDCIGDFANEHFANSFADLQPFLTSQVQVRPFALPASLAHFPGMLVAECALEAWMLVLNPACQLYGEHGFLDSDEYLNIKQIAILEIAAIWDGSVNNKNAVDVTSPLAHRLTEAEEDIVNALDHLPKSLKEIANAIACNYQTVRKYIPRLRELGLAKKVRQGHIRGDASLDAIPGNGVVNKA